MYSLTKTLRRVAVLALALGGLAFVVPGVAAAKPTYPIPNPPCSIPGVPSTYIYSNLTLTSSQDCTGASAGYIVGTDGITINLAGFHIYGPHSGIGIANVGNNHVTVANGFITGFATGLYLDQTNRNTVSNVATYGNGTGLVLTGSSGAVLNRVAATWNGGNGMFMFANHRTLLANSRASHNGNNGVEDHLSSAMISGVTANRNGNEGFRILGPIRYVNNLGRVVFYTVANSKANFNGDDGFFVLNAPSLSSQARLFRDTAHFNHGFGYWALYRVAFGSLGNKALGNDAGNSHNVPYTLG